MSLQVPDGLKKLIGAPMREASALDSRDPLMAYFCRLHSMQTALPQVKSVPGAEAFLLSLMERLEKDKQQLTAAGHDLSDPAHAALFAVKVFKVADDQDRAGNGTKGTARTFMAAATFFDVLSQFGDVPADLAEKRKYARWKAHDILTALREGRTPVPGPPGGLANEEERELAELEAAVQDSTTSVTPAQTSTSTTMDAPIPTLPDDSMPMAPTDLSATNNGDGDADQDEVDEKQLNAMLFDLPTVPSIHTPELSADSMDASAPPSDYTDANVQSAHHQMPSVSAPATVETPPGMTEYDRQQDERLRRILANQQAAMAQQTATLMHELEAQRQQVANLKTLVDQQRMQMSAHVNEKTQLANNLREAHAKIQAGGGGMGASAANAVGSGQNAAVVSTGSPSADELTMATKHARFVSSALQFDDLDTAIKECKLVLRLLTGVNAIVLDTPTPKH